MSAIWGWIKDMGWSGLLAARNRRVLGRFVRDDRAAQNAADIFKGEWIGSFPPALGVQAGSRPLYEDPRIAWMLQRVDARGRRVLELGPMEGGHTCQLLRAGAASVTAVESNTRSYLKCLVARELLAMDRARFVCADFVAWMDSHPESYDVCLASGVLYHMTEPLKLLDQICGRAPAVFLWTHYYDAARIRGNRAQSHLFGPAREIEWRGFKAAARSRRYGAQKWNPLHLGGRAPFSYWLPREAILDALRFYGMTRIELGPEDPDHPAGPAFSLVAFREQAQRAG